jgi:acetyl-CoA carboxylase beta subunit
MTSEQALKRGIIDQIVSRRQQPVQVYAPDKVRA